jgi:hypothetical protein
MGVSPETKQVVIFELGDFMYVNLGMTLGGNAAFGCIRYSKIGFRLLPAATFASNLTFCRGWFGNRAANAECQMTQGF